TPYASPLVQTGVSGVSAASPTHDGPHAASVARTHAGDGYGEHVVLGEVGRGGLRRVLSAYDRRLDRRVALKEALNTDERQRQRFLHEARLTARLQHPSIVPVYELGEREDGTPYYAMKLVDGEPLSTVVARCANLHERLAL